MTDNIIGESTIKKYFTVTIPFNPEFPAIAIWMPRLTENEWNLFMDILMAMKPGLQE